jgi:hypothetical protein
VDGIEALSALASRIQAVDLRDAERKARALRADGADEVYLDIEVFVAADALAALRSADHAQSSSGTMRYVGTPKGLAGLIADIRTLGIADGVVLKTRNDIRVVNLVSDDFPT